MNLSLEIDAGRLMAALHKAPAELEKHLDNAVSRIAHTIARDAKLFAPKGGTSVLANSINASRVSPAHYIVAPSANYARMVEEGTEPGYFPPFDNIHDWVKQMGLAPRHPGDTTHDIAWRIMHGIFYGGTEPQPFMQPAFEENLADAERRISAAIDTALGTTA